MYCNFLCFSLGLVSPSQSASAHCLRVSLQQNASLVAQRNQMHQIKVRELLCQVGQVTQSYIHTHRRTNTHLTNTPQVINAIFGWATHLLLGALM